MLPDMIKDCKDETKVLEKARAAISLVINKSYQAGAPLDFLESLDKTLDVLFDRIADVQEIKAQCHRKLESTGQLAKSLELA